MSSRQASYKQSISLDHHLNQAKRRLDALRDQRARRSDTLDRIRGIEDLVLSSDSEEQDERFQDADESQIDFSTSSNLINQPCSGMCPSQHDLTTASKTETRKYRRFKNRCMRAELLDLCNGLPDGFEEDWLMVGPVPKGQRCLVLTSQFSSSSKSCGPGKRLNTLILSRTKAHVLGYFQTVVPLGCILDCIYSEDTRVLWVLDVLKWKDQSFIDCESDFRFYWRDTRLQELEIQSLSSPNRLLVVPVPYVATCSKTGTLDLTSALLANNKETTTVTVWSSIDDSLKKVEIPHEADGLLLCIKSATYESGDTVLAGWVPLLPNESEQENEVGVGRLNAH
ncbi:uncharacterized protein MELLADRAFT_89372 [Melampsora larici-populina 98AG31]|uniref:Snurportin-1 n=1 Tax=Melampsora larici-populina (strain 98AG31 / pathotype 3-4-7) TaxID=747676 RepID=F4R5Y0_MELLP|nr:uncharacterized protein MELLADRAFT_89372 [Melampsora larici-populina 98AG31]EGG12117.1 hypothetical protein MELLADRAFT_89372 [Melampsora larici-populina 98AG31]